MKQNEIIAAINEQYTKKLNAEHYLSSTDYIAAKLAEGVATADEYAEKIILRQNARDEINAAMKEIERLETLVPENVEPNE